MDEFIINPRQYQDRLTELLKEVTHSSSLFISTKGKSSVRDVEAVLDGSPNIPSLYLPSIDRFSKYTRPLIDMDADNDFGHTNPGILELRRCQSVLKQVNENIHRMRTCGFCTTFISALFLDFERYDAVHLHRLDTKVVQDLFDLLSGFLEGEAKAYCRLKLS